MPSEFVIPTVRPARAQMCAMSRVVVLFPFVPVIGHDRDSRPRQVRQRPERDRAQSGELAAVGRAAERQPCRRAADRLRDRPAAPGERDRRPPLDRPSAASRCAARAGRGATCSRATRQRRRVGRGLGRGPGARRANSSFTAGRLKNRFGPSSTRSSTSSTCGSRWSASRGMAREYIDRHARPDRAAAHRRRAPAALPRRARDAGEHRLRLVHARRRQPGRRPRGRCAARARRGRRAHRPSPGRRRPQLGRPRHRPVRRRRPAAPAHRPHGHRLRSGHGRGAAVSVRGRPRLRSRRDRHEGGAAGRAARHRRAAARPARGRPSPSSPTRTRRSARRSARRSSARSRPTTTPCSSSSAPAPTATSSARARASPTTTSTLTGRAAHAGVEPEKGRSAILEAAHQVLGAPRAQRPLADGDRQRRRHPRRHAPERRRRALRAAGRPARGDGRGLRAPPRPRSSAWPCVTDASRA